MKVEGTVQDGYLESQAESLESIIELYTEPP